MTKARIERIARRVLHIAVSESNGTVEEWAFIVLDWLDRGRSASRISKSQLFRAVRSVYNNGDCH